LERASGGVDGENGSKLIAASAIAGLLYLQIVELKNRNPSI
jgi:hypothetical protein